MTLAEFEKYAKEHNIFYCTKELQEPCDDTVSRGVFEQVKWERDIAIEQLNELGYELGQKIEPCDDVVSREDAVQCVLSSMFLAEASEKINNLPSVRPQEPTGHWKNKEFRKEEYVLIGKCSVCGRGRVIDGFCSYCGCRMVEPQESEDKE